MSSARGLSYRVADDVHLVRTQISNVLLIGGSASSWVLVDAGMYGYAQRIRDAAEEVFGPGARPAAIVLTHGHFDHRGSLAQLLEWWDVPVYAHTLELPHLTGRVAYPPPDPLAGGGMMAWASRLYPRRPIDIGPALRVLPPDRSVPGAPGWEWTHSPGHTDGHVSLYHQLGGVLVAGDALTTTKAESMLAVATDRREVHGPPAYFTSDWDAARDSVRRLAALAPDVLVSGHGLPLRGPRLRRELIALARDFDSVARPKFGRYSQHAARLRLDGTYELPPDPFPAVAGALGLAGAAAVWAWRAQRRERPRRVAPGRSEGLTAS